MMGNEGLCTTCGVDGQARFIPKYGIWECRICNDERLYRDKRNLHDLSDEELSEFEIWLVRDEATSGKRDLGKRLK